MWQNKCLKQGRQLLGSYDGDWRIMSLEFPQRGLSVNADYYGFIIKGERASLRYRAGEGRVKRRHRPLIPPWGLDQLKLPTFRVSSGQMGDDHPIYDFF